MADHGSGGREEPRVERRCELGLLRRHDPGLPAEHRERPRPLLPEAIAPAADGVVVEIEHPRQLLAAQPVIEQQHRIGAARDAVPLGRPPHQRLQVRPLVRREKSALIHEQNKNPTPCHVNP
jgi:hypothetical protein